MDIDGKCHRGNITFVLNWPGDGANIPVRACGCAFCIRHGGAYTSHGDAASAAVVHDERLVSRCGVVPFVTSVIDENLYPVVNVNSFEGIGPACFDRDVSDFDGETTDNRLDRRKRNWIPTVTIGP